MPPPRAQKNAVKWFAKDGEGDPDNPGPKLYDEPVNVNNKEPIINWPPNYNDMSSAWVVRVVASSGWAATSSNFGLIQDPIISAENTRAPSKTGLINQSVGEDS